MYKYIYSMYCCLYMCVCGQLCNSDELWKETMMSYFDVITEDMELLVKAMGWKKLFMFHYIQKQECSVARPAEDEPNPVTSQ